MTEEQKATNDKIILNCHVEGSDPSTAKPLTVGDTFKVECATERFVLNPAKLKFITKKPYQLQILKTEMQPDGRLQLMVTSYQVGDFKEDDLNLSDGIAQVPVKGIEFKVESVIDKQNPPKGPYGPFGGYMLTMPMFYLWSVIGLVVLVGLGVTFKVLRRWQQKRLIDGLKKHDSRLGPQTQLHVRFRQLERSRFLEGGEVQKHLAEIDDILRLFIIRQFKIPAYDWSDRLIIKDFQHRFGFLGSDASKELMVLLRETRKTKSSAVAQSKDVEQLTRKIKRWADQVDRMTGSHSRHRGASL